MSKFVDGKFVIEEEPKGKCELCGAIEERRPYGPKGEQVCFKCGMKDLKAAHQQYMARLDRKDN